MVEYHRKEAKRDDYGNVGRMVLAISAMVVYFDDTHDISSWYNMHVSPTNYLIVYVAASRSIR